jgi:DNA invertase Pin-like site-specific DNA recombinase
MELVEYARNRQFVIYKTYVDKISGIKDSRPALNDLMMDARKKRFDAVLVWKLDRLGRSLQHLIFMIQEWDSLGIKFICMTQNIDTTSHEGKLIFHIFGAIAEFERGIIRDRIMIGLDRAKREGKKLGRPKGKKDTKRRRRSGYYQRWSKKSSP